jgi:putative membrane protein
MQHGNMPVDVNTGRWNFLWGIKGKRNADSGGIEDFHQQKGRDCRMRNKTVALVLLGTYVPVLIWSMINPRDWLTWFLEQSPILIGICVLLFTYKRFPLTKLTYIWLWFTAILVSIGGHYTYEHMPLFEWVQQKWDLSRNHYDRFGHFFKGVASMLFFRELLLRTTQNLQGKWLFILVTSLSLSLAALYEIVEFAAALIAGGNAKQFLGAQGDEWDAQWDMTLNLVAAVLGYPLLRKLHDRALAPFLRKAKKEEPPV